MEFGTSTVLGCTCRLNLTAGSIDEIMAGPMATDVKEQSNHFLKPSTGYILLHEWVYWLAGAIFAFAAANFIMSGSIFIKLAIPFAYDGDSLFHGWMAQRVIEGWIFDNPRSGYPFGSSFLDYPGSDSANHFLLKLIGIVSENFQVAMNLYFLLGFPVLFAVSYIALRRVGLSVAFAIAGAFAFDFLPFHFLRLSHLFYTWYFCVPIFFNLGLICYNAKNIILPSRFKMIMMAAGLAALASFGVYNALFGIIVLSVSGISGALSHNSLRPVWLTTVCVVVATAGVALNILPNIINNHVNGNNPEVGHRESFESELYGLKLMQLIMPQAGHRISELAGIAESYNQTSPLINENRSASLGMIGAAGLAVLLSVLVLNASGGKADNRLSLLALITFVLFLFGTIGGLGSLFANIISPAIRGWNRISVFIGFAAITAALIVIETFTKRYFSSHHFKIASATIAAILVVLAFYDQTKPACSACIEQTSLEFNHDRTFVQEIERQMPSGAAIYQLPYMAFPEVQPLHELPTYGLMTGFLHSKSLRWSYAGMKGRPGDLFFRSLAHEPIAQQIEIIKKIGFSGIYIDRRGYVDNGDEIISKIKNALGYGPSIEHGAKRMVFFPLIGVSPQPIDNLSSEEIMHKATYFVDRLGKRHQATLVDGIDFTQGTWPSFLRDVRGLSIAEPWGRWSDANLGESVQFDFVVPLPTKFTLVISAKPFGRDGTQRVQIRIGDQTHTITLRPDNADIRLPITLGGHRVDMIEFIPQDPVSPQQMGLDGDGRRLGVGFNRLRFE
jgi:phosphoglycerol transferase